MKKLLIFLILLMLLRWSRRRVSSSMWNMFEHVSFVQVKGKGDKWQKIDFNYLKGEQMLEVENSKFEVCLVWRRENSVFFVCYEYWMWSSCWIRFVRIQIFHWDISSFDVKHEANISFQAHLWFVNFPSKVNEMWMSSDHNNQAKRYLKKTRKMQSKKQM